MAIIKKRWKTAASLLYYVILLLTAGCGTPEQGESTSEPLTDRVTEQGNSVRPSSENEATEQQRVFVTGGQNGGNAGDCERNAGNRNSAGG